MEAALGLENKSTINAKEKQVNYIYKRKELNSAYHLSKAVIEAKEKVYGPLDEQTLRSKR